MIEFKESGHKTDYANLEDLHYYSIPAVSNSALKEINPEQGGSPAASAEIECGEGGEVLLAESLLHAPSLRHYPPRTRAASTRTRARARTLAPSAALPPSLTTLPYPRAR